MRKKRTLETGEQVAVGSSVSVAKSVRKDADGNMTKQGEKASEQRNGRKREEPE
jgi:hypothetical protein